MLVGKLRDENTGFGATNVQTDKIFVLLRQASAPQFKMHKLICARASRFHLRTLAQEPEVSGFKTGKR